MGINIFQCESLIGIPTNVAHVLEIRRQSNISLCQLLSLVFFVVLLVLVVFHFNLFVFFLVLLVKLYVSSF